MAEHVSVTDNHTKSRYEAHIGAELAGFAQYQLHPGLVVFTHTETFDGFEGHGVGSALAAGALDHVRHRGLKVVAECPFIADFIDRHPDYADLVDR